MFDDFDDFFNEEDTLRLLDRYREILLKKSGFLDVGEFEIVIEHFADRFSFKEAIEAVRLGLHQHPTSAPLKLKYIQLLIETGKPARALGLLKTIQKADITGHEFYLAKGAALNLTGKYREAKVEFEKALRHADGPLDDVAYSIAHSFLQMEMPASAIRYLMMALHHQKDNLLVLYDLAVCYERTDAPEKSIACYRRYLDLDPFAEFVWNNLGQLYAEMGKISDALEAFDYALAVSPQYYSAYFSKADLYLMNDNPDKAIEVFEELLLWDPSNVHALCELGNCHREVQNYSDAMKAYTKAIGIADDCPEAWYGKGMVYCHQNRFRLAVSPLKKAVNLQPENPDYWFMYGEASAATGKLDQAITAYTKASELNPHDIDAWLSCAQIMFIKKRITEAIYLLTRFYRYHENNPTLNYRLAAYHAYLDNKQEALQYFEKGLSLNFPEHRELFNSYPKTKNYPGFKRLIDKLLTHRKTA
jgi:tetratricopeptide (TPR) repeat protein